MLGAVKPELVGQEVFEDGDRPGRVAAATPPHRKLVPRHEGVVVVAAQHPPALGQQLLERRHRAREVARRTAPAGHVVPGDQRLRVVGAEDAELVGEQPLERENRVTGAAARLGASVGEEPPDEQRVRVIRAEHPQTVTGQLLDRGQRTRRVSRAARRAHQLRPELQGHVMVRTEDVPALFDERQPVVDGGGEQTTVHETATGPHQHGVRLGRPERDVAAASQGEGVGAQGRAELRVAFDRGPE